MTKKEILDDVILNYTETRIQVTIEDCYKAMEIYAKQQAVLFAIHYNRDQDRMCSRYDHFIKNPDGKKGV